MIESLCDNRNQTSDSCLNPNSTLNCYQLCPYGKILANINKLNQLKLELMEPCEIIKDYNFLLTESDSLHSYFFGKSNNNNKCVNDGTASVWKPFIFNLTSYKFFSELSSMSVLQNGFSVSLWFKQFISNYG